MTVLEATRVRPVGLAGERRVPLVGPLGGLVPGGGVQRGTVVSVAGPPGAGSTSLMLGLVASATAAGEWAAIVDTDGRVGGVAAAEAGVVLERLAVVRSLPAGTWSRVVATLLEGVSLVAAVLGERVSPADARRLTARARERGAVLVVAETVDAAQHRSRWPGEAAVRLSVEASEWSGLGQGTGLLGTRVMRVTASGRGAAGMSRTVDICGLAS
ncbi:MAG: hypothetical protein ACRDY7_09245 [Acidimicrobiia bacterium]